MSASTSNLVTELRAYEKHKEELLSKGEGQFVLIHDDDVIGLYDTESDAISEGYRRFGNVPFFVKEVVRVEIPERFVSNLIAL